MMDQRLDDYLDDNYNINIVNLSNQIKESRNLILADFSADNIGRTCGDYVKLDMVLEGKRVYFGVEIHGCIHAKASGKYMLDLVNGKSIEEVSEIFSSFKKEIQSMKEERSELSGAWENLILDKNKESCILAPWEALNGALENFFSQTCSITNEKKVGLGCDACVISNNLRWEKNENNSNERKSLTEKNESKKSLYKILKELNKRTKVIKIGKFEDQYLSFQKYGKIILDENEKENLINFVEVIKENEIDHLRRLRFMGILAYHCKNLNIKSINPELERLFTRAIIKSTIQEKVIDIINKIIDKEEINAVFIKGSKTRELYPERTSRYSNDLDLLTLDFDNAIKICSALIRYENFYLPLRNGVAFSLKYVMDNNGSIILTGHYHMEKYLAKHRLNIDVSFPGLPLGLLNTTHYPNVENKTLSYEDQFIITLSHLFKHELPYMKDINDLYLIIKQQKVDIQKLESLVEKYSLNIFTVLITRYIDLNIDKSFGQSICIKNYEKKLSYIDKKIIDKSIKDGWPYKLGSHFLVQAYDIHKRLKKSKGLKDSIKDLEKIIINKRFSQNNFHFKNVKENDLYLRQLEVLGISLYERLFLIQVISFEDYFEISKENIVNLEKNNFKIYKFEANSLIIKSDIFTLLLTPVGLFLTTKDWSCQGDRKELTKTVFNIIDCIGYKRDRVKVVRSVNNN